MGYLPGAVQVVVKALAESPWGIYMRYIRPGRIGEISVVGVLLLLGTIVALAIGILITMPDLKMPALTPFIDRWGFAIPPEALQAVAKDITQMPHVIFNAYTHATLTALLLFVVFSILFYALKVGIAAWGTKERTDKEAPFQALPDA